MKYNSTCLILTFSELFPKNFSGVLVLILVKVANKMATLKFIVLATIVSVLLTTISSASGQWDSKYESLCRMYRRLGFGVYHFSYFVFCMRHRFYQFKGKFYQPYYKLNVLRYKTCINYNIILISQIRRSCHNTDISSNFFCCKNYFEIPVV